MEQFRLSLEHRKKTALAVVGIIFLIILAGVIKLQIVDHSELSIRSEKNRIRLEPIIPQRGKVFDQQHNLIIDNRPSYTVSVIPTEEVPGVTLLNLSELIGLDTSQIRKRIKRNTVNRYLPAPVKRDIPFEVVAVLEEQNRKFPGDSQR